MTAGNFSMRKYEKRLIRERNESVNMELVRRLRNRTEEEAMAALLSLTLFPERAAEKSAAFA